MSAARMAPLSSQEEQDKWLAGASPRPRHDIEIQNRNQIDASRIVFVFRPRSGCPPCYLMLTLSHHHPPRTTPQTRKT
jgi:hypothetical protein